MGNKRATDRLKPTIMSIDGSIRERKNEREKERKKERERKREKEREIERERKKEQGTEREGRGDKLDRSRRIWTSSEAAENNWGGRVAKLDRARRLDR